MKKLFSILLVLFWTSIYCFGQKHKGDSPLIIEYDFFKDTLLKHPIYRVNQNSFVELRIKNVNPLRYKLNFSEYRKNFTNSTTTNGLSSEINLLSFQFNPSQYKIEIPAELYISITPEVSKFLTKKNEVLEAEKLQGIIYDLKSKYDAINKVDSVSEEEKVYNQKQKDYILNNLESLGFPINSFEASLFDLQKKISSTKLELDNYTDSQTKNSLLDIQFREEIKFHQKSIDSLEQIGVFYHSLLVVAESNQSAEEIIKNKSNLIKDFFGRELKNYEIIQELNKRLEIEREWFLKLSDTYSKIQVMTDAKYASAAKEVFSNIRNQRSQIDKNNFENLFHEIMRVLDFLVIENFTITYKTLSLPGNMDFIQYNFKAEPKSSLQNSIGIKPIDLNYKVKVVGGIRIDISTGIFWNFLTYDSIYTYYKDPNDPNKTKIQSENKNAFIPDFGVLFHVYRRSTSDVKLGGNFGISTDTQRIAYYLGASVLLGRSERFNLNFGLSGRQINRMAFHPDGMTLNQPIDSLQSPVVPLLNPAPFRIGAFVGLSFNLLNQKENEYLEMLNSRN